MPSTPPDSWELHGSCPQLLWVSARITPQTEAIWYKRHPTLLPCFVLFPVTCCLSPAPEYQGGNLSPSLLGSPPPTPLEYCLTAQEGSCELLGKFVFSDRDSQKMNRGQAWALRRASSSWPWKRSRPWPTSTRWKGPSPTCSGDTRTWRASWKGSRRYLSFAFCRLGCVSSCWWVVKLMCPKCGWPRNRESGTLGGMFESFLSVRATSLGHDQSVAQHVRTWGPQTLGEF